MTDMQYMARNTEDGQIYWLRPVHTSKPDIYFVFKKPYFSDKSYCGMGYCKHYEIIEESPIETQAPVIDKKKDQPKPKAEKPKSKQMNLLAGLTPKPKPVQMKLF